MGGCLISTVRTTKDLPFGDLSSLDFHRLVLFLVHRDARGFSRIENWGASGSDGGADILAETSEGEKVLIQVKRHQRFSKSMVVRELGQLRPEEAGGLPDIYILAISSTPSAQARKALRQECEKLSIPHSEVWDRSTLTAKALRHRDLFEHFFGPAWAEPQDGTWTKAVRDLIYEVASKDTIVLLGRGEEMTPGYLSCHRLDELLRLHWTRSLPSDTADSLSSPLKNADLEALNRARILRGEISEDDLLEARLRIYDAIDHDPELRAVLGKLCHEAGRAFSCNLIKQLGDLLCSDVVQGIIELSPDLSLSRYVDATYSYSPELLRSEDPPGSRPFLWNVAVSQLNQIRLSPASLTKYLASWSVENGDETEQPGSDTLSRERVLVALNLSPSDESLLGRVIERGGFSNVYLILPDPVLIEAQATWLKLDAKRWLHELSGYSGIGHPLSHICRQLHFDGEPSLHRILASEGIRPEDAKVALKPLVLDPWYRELRRDRRRTIRERSGTGKTMLAFLLAEKLSRETGAKIFYLPCEEIEIEYFSPDQLESFFADFSIRHPNGALILEDYHLIRSITHSFFERMSLARASGPFLIFVITKTEASSHKIGGQIVYRFRGDEAQRQRSPDESPPYEWKKERPRLLDWLQEHQKELLKLGVAIDDDLRVELSLTKNMWHFFYVLRGGSAKLAQEAEESRGQFDADLIWFAVSALYFFVDNRRPNLQSVIQFIEQAGLQPDYLDHVSTRTWISECLLYLLSKHRLLHAAGTFLPRHHLEAATLVRFLLVGRPSGVDEIRASIISLLRDRIEPIRVSDESRRILREGDKRTVYGFIDREIRRVSAKILRYDTALAEFPALESFFAEVWSELTAALEDADIHSLYALANRLHELSSGSFLYNPIRFVQRMGAFEDLHTVSDAIDFSVFLNGAIGRDGLKQKALAASLMGITLYDEVQEIATKAALATFAKKGQIEPSELKALASDSYSAALEVVGNQEIQNLATVVGIRQYLEIFNQRRSEVDHLLKVVPEEVMKRNFARVGDLVSFLVTAHLWMLSPEYAQQTIRSMPASWLDDLVREIEGGISYSTFHMSEDSVLFADFFKWLGAIDPRIEALRLQYLAENQDFSKNTQLIESAVSYESLASAERSLAESIETTLDSLIETIADSDDSISLG